MSLTEIITTHHNIRLNEDYPNNSHLMATQLGSDFKSFLYYSHNGDCIPLLEINECLAECFYTYNNINSPCKQAKDLNLELYIVIG